MQQSAFQPRPFSQWPLAIDRPLIIAGPCGAESEAQVLEAARAIAANGRARAFRAGIWKPRTRPNSFEGRGEPALEWLKSVKQETGLLTITEVANTAHVEACLKAGVDMLWIGARTTPNPFTVQEIADSLRGTDIPVFVKNPINPDLQLWIGALERLMKAGLSQVGAIHRGFSWFGERTYRNSPMWEFPIRLKTHFPELEVLCDPSHIAGERAGIAGVAQKALDLNLSGLMVEVHPSPDQALSDAQQQLAPPQFTALMDQLVFRDALPEGEVKDHLLELRGIIDQLDEEIAQKLGARLAVAERIGEHKFHHNVAIQQPQRFEEILERQKAMGRNLALSEAFINAFMNAIHEESIERQTRIWEALKSGSPAFLHNGKENGHGKI